MTNDGAAAHPFEPLDDPPIVEAVVDIDCDLPVGFQLEQLAERAAESFKPQYPQEQRRYVHQQQFSIKADLTEPVSGRRDLDALLFLEPGEKQLVQVRAAGYSFNRLRPYTSFDDYLPEISRTWSVYRDLAQPAQVRRVRMRYINRILLPSLTDGSVDLREYVAVSWHMPEDNSFVLRGFLEQHTAVEQATGNVVNILLSGQPPEGNRIPIIFDNGVEAELVTPPDAWQSIEHKLRELRHLKNRIFALTLTPKCLNLFRHSPDSE